MISSKKINSCKNIRKTSQMVSNEPGWYRWWFDEDGTSTILKPLADLVQTSKLQQRKIDGKVYYALYFGISKELNNRLKWHITQHHTASSVKSGFLSTLRQTISALLGINMTDSENAVNDYIDKHCYLEYDCTSSHAAAKQIEASELSSGYYPLNIQENKVLPKDVQNKLKKLRKTYKH